MIRLEKIIFTIWVCIVVVVVGISSKERLRPFIQREGVAVSESWSSRSVVRLGSSNAAEFKDGVVLRVSISSGRVERIEEGKFSVDLVTSELFARMVVGKKTIRKVVHRGDLYKKWEEFTQKNEVPGILTIFGENEGKSIPLFFRAPEFFIDGQILQFRLNVASANDIPKFVGRGDLRSVDLIDLKFGESKIELFP